MSGPPIEEATNLASVVDAQLVHELVLSQVSLLRADRKQRTTWRSQRRHIRYVDGVAAVDVHYPRQLDRIDYGKRTQSLRLRIGCARRQWRRGRQEYDGGNQPAKTVRSHVAALPALNELEADDPAASVRIRRVESNWSDNIIDRRRVGIENVLNADYRVGFCARPPGIHHQLHA